MINDGSEGKFDVAEDPLLILSWKFLKKREVAAAAWALLPL